MRRCEICGKEPVDEKDAGRNFDTHHILFQSSADVCGRVDDGKRGQNDLSNLVILCKDDHQRVHMGELFINGWKDTSNGRVLDWRAMSERELNTGRRRRLGNRVLTEELIAQLRPLWEEGFRIGNWSGVINRLLWDYKIRTKETTFRKIYES